MMVQTIPWKSREQLTQGKLTVWTQGVATGKLLLLLLHPFNGLFYRTTWVAGTRKVNHSGFCWSKRWWGGSGISWTICKSYAPRSRQMTMPVPHHTVFTGQMPFLPPNQQYQSTEGSSTEGTVVLVDSVPARNELCLTPVW